MSLKINYGVSLVISNTLKGDELISQIKEQVDIIEVSDVSEVYQHNLVSPTECPSNRSDFWLDYSKLSFKEIKKKYTKIEYDKNINKPLWFLNKAYTKIKNIGRK